MPLLPVQYSTESVVLTACLFIFVVRPAHVWIVYWRSVILEYLQRVFLTVSWSSHQFLKENADIVKPQAKIPSYRILKTSSKCVAVRVLPTNLFCEIGICRGSVVEWEACSLRSWANSLKYIEMLSRFWASLLTFEYTARHTTEHLSWNIGSCYLYMFEHLVSIKERSSRPNKKN